jgi:hypothetical protein
MSEADISPFIRNPKAGIQGSNEDLATCPSYTCGDSGRKEMAMQPIPPVGGVPVAIETMARVHFALK